MGFGFRKAYNNGKTGTDANGNDIYEYPAGLANFSVSLSGLTLDSENGNIFRLVNEVSDGSNMVYLYVDNQKVGALNHYYSRNENKNCTDDWISGKDFVLSFMGSTGEPDNEVMLLNQCSFDYIQIWEGGGFDTGRLTQLQQEFEETKATVSGYIGFAAYQEAVRASDNFTGTQEQCDAHVEAIISARNAMTMACDPNTTSGEIISVDLVTGDYARIGKQVSLRITTAPDVASISVGSEKLTSVSSMVQTVKLNKAGTYQDALVKVWFVTFDSEITSEQTVAYPVKTQLADSSEGKEIYTKTVNFL